MSRIRLCLEVSMLLLICLGGLLLSAALSDFLFLATAAISGLLGWLIVDRWGILHLPNWLANVVSVFVLFYTMRDFFSGDSSYQLTSVAALLVYLQSVLMFQRKLPRQYWQLLVLNFLQIVVAAVFSLQFEGGVLFLAYMALAGITLWLLATYDQFHRAAMPQPPSAQRSVARWVGRRGPAADPHASRPVLTADAPHVTWRAAGRTAGHLASWMLISFCFSVVLFVLLPRSERAWFGPLFRPVAATGSSRNIKTMPNVVVMLSSDRWLRLYMRNSVTDEPLRFDEPPYLRGMAFGTWAVRDGHTTWEAPYDRIHMDLYESLPAAPPREDLAQIDITLEPTNDPLLYVIPPVVVPWGSDESMEFCHELSAVTRRRGSDQIEMNLYRYTFLVPYTASPESPQFIRLTDYYPYQPQTRSQSGQSMAGNPGEEKWLTYFDRSRYPTVVQVAENLARDAGTDNHLAIARAMERHLAETGGFSYTLDFRDVTWNRDLDVIEDFVRNVRRGHCELYASALVLMLRSQGIPARYVTGILGGDLNELGEFYMMHAGLAHAWVEVYIRPEDCSSEMRRDRQIAERGAWVRLDPTPASSLLERFYRGSTAFDYARTIWEDYVLGLDSQTQGDWTESAGAVLLGIFDMSGWSARVQGTFSAIQARPIWQLGLLGSLIAVMIGGLTWALRRRKGGRADLPGVSGWRRWIGSVLSLVSPEIGQWVLNPDPARARVGFYRRLLHTLEQLGLERRPGETIWEFSRRAGQSFGSQPAAELAAGHLQWLTQAFHEIRFGGRQVSGDERAVIVQRLSEFERAVRADGTAKSRSAAT